MSTIVSIFFKLGILISSIASSKANYVRHRDNILNKGTWVKNDNDNNFDKSGFGDFIFKPSSVNVDDLFQDDFYGFGSNHIQDSPFVSKFIERAKRSPNLLETGLRKSVKDCNGKDCNQKNIVTNQPIMKSKFTPKEKPAALIGMYPYDIAILMNHVKNHNKVIEEPVSDAIDRSLETNSIDELNYDDNQMQNSTRPFEVVMGNGILLDDNLENFNNNMSIPKRSMDKNYESELIKKIEIVEGINASRKYDRNIFDEKTRTWNQAAPVHDVNIYKVIPKGEKHTVSEKGLIKLLTILTRTFKKIMLQHSEIKKMHSEMFAGKEDVDKSISLLISKFNDFESKYTDIKDTNEKIKELHKKMEAKEEYIKNKELEISHNLADFENQQKKFLTQQRQFYNIQKLMLAQNEKINAKQSMIAKTQSEISRRQNNFARILKKAKQIYIDKKQTNLKLQPKIVSVKESDTKSITTALPITTESVKIDLFSIPPLETHIENHDKLILKEKDQHPVDDLVYKYYFNNTFIDTLMRSHVLSGPLHGNKYITRNVKTKRNKEEMPEISTILLPIVNSTSETKVPEKRRAKRWIRHHRSKGKRRHHKFGSNYEMKDDKPSHPNDINNMIDKAEKTVPTTAPTPTTANNKLVLAKEQKKAADIANPVKKEFPLNELKMINPFLPLEKVAAAVEKELNPFMTMAANFCNKIGQNGNPLMLSWCVEKVLRRLQNIETIPVVATLQQAVPVSTPKPAAEPTQKKSTRVTSTISTPPVTKPVANLPSVSTRAPVLSQSQSSTTTVQPKTMDVKNQSLLPGWYFPDNDELESNLKQYELKPDEEGTVYYEGSVHASEMIGRGDSDGFSDFMPGLDSNSRVQLDPLTFDIQSKRRAAVRRMNEDMKKQRGIA